MLLRPSQGAGRSREMAKRCALCALSSRAGEFLAFLCTPDAVGAFPAGRGASGNGQMVRSMRSKFSGGDFFGVSHELLALLRPSQWLGFSPGFPVEFGGFGELHAPF